MVPQCKKTNETEWKNIELINNWENYDTANYPPAQFKKIENHIFLRGLIKRISGSSERIGVLPEGNRPYTTMYSIVNSNDTFCSAYTEKNGAICIHGVSNNAWVDISGINFFID